MDLKLKKAHPAHVCGQNGPLVCEPWHEDWAQAGSGGFSPLPQKFYVSLPSYPALIPRCQQGQEKFIRLNLSCKGVTEQN